MSNYLEILHIKKCVLISQGAEPIPPLGTILGNLGVNTVKFCEEFNNYTNILPIYFLLLVKIIIYDNKSFKFTTTFPTTTFIINLLKFEQVMRIKHFDRFIEKIIYCINLKDLLQLALIKFPKMKLIKSIKIIIGSIKSMNITIINNL